MSQFNVRDFGAIGDGTTRDTTALQRAIDACHDSGGGKVLLPAGTYLSGTIYLKSNVELHLCAGAQILASPHREDYNPEDIFPENVAFSRENVTGHHLIIAYRAKDVAITGQGIINGNSSQFFAPLPPGLTASYRYKSGNFPIGDWRPGQMIFFCRCQGVRASDVQLLNSPYWTLFLMGCQDVQIRGLLIENPPATANGDGIDLDCCKNVTVSDCIIRSGDDAIAVRANRRRLGEGDWTCEDIAISNCILSTPCNAIRVGVGDGHIRKVLFNNINIPEASRGICLVSQYRKTQHSRHGTRLEDIHFSNVLIDADVPITAGTGHESARPGGIDDITFRNFRVIAHAGAQLVGTPQTPLGKVLLQNIDWTVRGGSDNTNFHQALPEPLSHHGYKGREDQPALPCALLAREIADLRIENFTLEWDKPAAAWRKAIWLDTVSSVDFNNLHLRQPHQQGAAIVCHNVEDLSLRNSRAARNTDIFLSLQTDGKSTFTRYGNNDFSQARIDHRRV